jgi:cyanophycinase
MLTTLVLSFSLLLLVPPEEPKVGPASGALVIDGGAEEPETIKSFVALAGGRDSPVVLIPTASESERIDSAVEKQTFARRFGLRRVTVLHTRDRAVADRESFVEPLKKARGVWFGEGRQWRLVDAYMGTRTQRELEAVLERGGVIGGSSAGATIQGSYLTRGAPEGNHILMAKGHEEGFAYLKNVAIDQHLLARRRQEDLVGVIEKRPELLGLGLDEKAAVIVRGDRMDVIGRSVVAIYDGKDHDGKRYYYLACPQMFDLAARKRMEPQPQATAAEPANAEGTQGQSRLRRPR